MSLTVGSCDKCCGLFVEPPRELKDVKLERLDKTTVMVEKLYFHCPICKEETEFVIIQHLTD